LSLLVIACHCALTTKLDGRPQQSSPQPPSYKHLYWGPACPPFILFRCLCHKTGKPALLWPPSP